MEDIYKRHPRKIVIELSDDDAKQFLEACCALEITPQVLFNGFASDLIGGQDTHGQTQKKAAGDYVNICRYYRKTGDGFARYLAFIGFMDLACSALYSRKISIALLEDPETANEERAGILQSLGTADGILKECYGKYINRKKDPDKKGQNTYEEALKDLEAVFPLWCDFMGQTSPELLMKAPRIEEAPPDEWEVAARLEKEIEKGKKILEGDSAARHDLTGKEIWALMTDRDNYNMIGDAFAVGFKRGRTFGAETIRFPTPEETAAFFAFRKRMGNEDNYHAAAAYLLAVDKVLRPHVERIFNFEEDCLKLEGYNESWQTGTTKRTTALLFWLFNQGSHTAIEEYGDRPRDLDWIMSGSLAEWYAEAIRIRYTLEL